MLHENEIPEQMKTRQHLLRLALDRQGLHLKAISHASGIKYSTLQTYLHGDREKVVVMPLSALVMLFKAIPDELLSMLTEPEGRVFAAKFDDDGTAELEEAQKLIAAAAGKRRAQA
jgi:hypothetical protein